MDPRKLFVDERLTGSCVYCGGKPDTKDHVPSKVLLDEPYPKNLPVVKACEACNANFSDDELYVACLVECIITGSCEPDGVRRDKVRRALRCRPALAARLARSRREDLFGGVAWDVESDRVRNVVLKLARGHVAYELSLPQVDDPEHIAFISLVSLSEDEMTDFDKSPAQINALWPEIGSHAFIHAVKNWPFVSEDAWTTVQPGRYRYIVWQDEGTRVQMVLSEYLACQVLWL